MWASVGSLLKEAGWARVADPAFSSDDAAERALRGFAESHFDPERTEFALIAPRPHSRTLATSTQAMSWHTDNVYDPEPCDAIALVCIAPGDNGGENLLVDSEQLISRLNAPDIAALRSPEWQWSVPGSSGVSEPRAVLTDERIRWWAQTVRLAAESQRVVAARVDAILNSLPPVTIRLAAGEALFTDNRRTLHARSEFTGARRVLRARFWR